MFNINSISADVGIAGVHDCEKRNGFSLLFILDSQYYVRAYTRSAYVNVIMFFLKVKPEIN